MRNPRAAGRKNVTKSSSKDVLQNKSVYVEGEKELVSEIADQAAYSR